MQISNPPEKASLNGSLDRPLCFLPATPLSSPSSSSPSTSLWSHKSTRYLNMAMPTDNPEQCYDNESVKFFYEKSGKNISDHWRRRDYVIVTLGMTVCFIVIFSNLLVIAAIFKNRRFHFPIYYLLGNLALADLFSGTALLHLLPCCCYYSNSKYHKLY